MFASWTFGRKVGTGFGLVVLLAGILAAVAVYAVRSVSASADRLVATDAHQLVEALTLRTIAETRAAVSRAFLLTNDRQFLDRIRFERERFAEALARMTSGATDDEQRRQLDEVRAAEVEYRASADQLFDHEPTAAAAESWEQRVRPKFERLNAALDAVQVDRERRLERARASWAESAGDTIARVVFLAACVVAMAAIAAVALTTGLGREIGSAAQHLQTSAAELHASASEQAATAKEQSTATNEITATMKELLASARQIAGSTQQVVRLAEQTGSAAETGQSALGETQESVATIKRQVDAIVSHMLDLGRRSQQIGVVLEIINELADQTNILSINASIEAAGAGEHGRRFGVVAEEIRRLADRVGSSTKEIGTLVDEIRAAANTTIMATEQGLKAADAGAERVHELVERFRQIAGLVVSTTESAREIEISTRQQTTAVEQVSAAMGEVARAAADVESGSRQTAQVAGQLVDLSRSLGRIVRAPEGG